MKKNSESIIINTHASFVPEQSDASIHKFVWQYEISIENTGTEILQLLSRHWRIIDMTGKIEEIQGVGVVGLQPLIKPSKQFHYKSFCQLATPQGTMEGFYVMQNLEEQQFEILVPKFILAAPSTMTEGYRSKLH